MNKFLLIISITILLITSCIKNNITEPEPEPGRRDYAWTIDTLNISAPAYFIWGS